MVSARHRNVLNLVGLAENHDSRRLEPPKQLLDEQGPKAVADWMREEAYLLAQKNTGFARYPF